MRYAFVGAMLIFGLLAGTSAHSLASQSIPSANPLITALQFSNIKPVFYTWHGHRFRHRYWDRRRRRWRYYDPMWSRPRRSRRGRRW